MKELDNQMTNQLKDYNGIISHYKKEYGKNVERSAKMHTTAEKILCDMNPEQARKFEIEKAKRHNSCVIGVSFCIESQPTRKPINLGTTEDLLRILGLGEKNE